MKQKKLTKLLVNGGLPHNVASAIAYNATIEAKTTYVKRLNRLAYDYNLNDDVPLDIMSKKHVVALYSAVKRTHAWYNSETCAPIRLSSVTLSVTEFLKVWNSTTMIVPWTASDVDPFGTYDIVGLGFDANHELITTQVPVFGDPTEWPTEVRAVIAVDWVSGNGVVCEIDTPLLFNYLTDSGYIA